MPYKDIEKKMSIIAKHQQDFRDTAKPYTGLWFGTGVGKTRTALYAVKECEGSILVVAPKTTVQKRQWQEEAFKLGMKLPIVMSKEAFRRDAHLLPRYKALIIDEAHYHFGVTPNTRQRNRMIIPKASQLYEATVKYIRTHKPDRFIPATATPNKTPMAIWAAGQMLGFKWDFYEFRNFFYTRLPMPNEIYTPKRDPQTIARLATLTHKIGQVLRLEDIKDVPDQTYVTELFDLTNKQKEVLKTLPARFTDKNSLRLKQHQVENGLLYEDVFVPGEKKVVRQVERISCEKIDYILERALEFPKMVIFANYTEQVDAIAAALRFQKYKVLIMDARTKDRKAVEKEAEESESAYIVAQSSVSSEWEFKSCPCMIFASLSNKALDKIQGMGRIQRYDCIKKNLYIDLVTSYPKSVDKRWHEVISSGQDFNWALYDKKYKND